MPVAPRAVPVPHPAASEAGTPEAERAALLASAAKARAALPNPFYLERPEGTGITCAEVIVLDDAPFFAHVHLHQDATGGWAERVCPTDGAGEGCPDCAAAGPKHVKVSKAKRVAKLTLMEAAPVGQRFEDGTEWRRRIATFAEQEQVNLDALREKFGTLRHVNFRLMRANGGYSPSCGRVDASFEAQRYSEDDIAGTWPEEALPDYALAFLRPTVEEAKALSAPRGLAPAHRVPPPPTALPGSLAHAARILDEEPALAPASPAPEPAPPTPAVLIDPHAAVRPAPRPMAPLPPPRPFKPAPPPPLRKHSSIATLKAHARIQAGFDRDPSLEDPSEGYVPVPTPAPSAPAPSAPALRPPPPTPKPAAPNLYPTKEEYRVEDTRPPRGQPWRTFTPPLDPNDDEIPF